MNAVEKSTQWEAVRDAMAKDPLTARLIVSRLMGLIEAVENLGGEITPAQLRQLIAKEIPQ